MRRLTHIQRTARASKLCIQCGHNRPPHRYTTSATTCIYCLSAPARDTVLTRASMRHKRFTTLAGMPYTVPCAKCHKARPASYYPWIPGSAQKGTVCNACQRRRSGRKGGRIALLPPTSPQDQAQRALLARVLAREQARQAEQARIQAQGKRCNDCWHVKPASEYGIDTRRRDGLNASCTACVLAYRVLSKTGQWLTARTALRALVENK